MVPPSRNGPVFREDGRDASKEHEKISIKTERVNELHPPELRVCYPLNRLFAIFQLPKFPLDILD
jgi:hypothetical protein